MVNPCCCVPLDVAVRLVGFVHIFALVRFDTTDLVGKSATLGYCAVTVAAFILMLLQGETKRAKRDLFIAMIVASLMMYLVYVPFGIMSKYRW